jgi:hypothetical protein
MIEFPYPETLLSKSNSSKKEHSKKIMKSGEIDEDASLKRRLFEKESIEYDVDENSNYHIMNYNENLNYVENLITPPPKNYRKVNNVLTDQKLSGVKYYQNDSLEKVQQIYQNNSGQYNMNQMVQYVPQVIYKSYKCKQATYSYLIPFCNKCNLPLILPVHPDFEIEMIPPVQMPHEHQTPHGHHMPQMIEREHQPQPQPISTPSGKPRNKHKNKKKSIVDENGKKIIRRRKRKTYEQLQQLVKEFQANPEWSKDNMQEVSQRTGLSEAQVYKWGWDQKRKMLDPNHDIHAELRLYKKQQDEEEEEERANMRKLKLPSSSMSNKKSGNKGEFATPNEKFIIKTRTTGSHDKENRNSENCQKTETRGVKRKLKALQVHNREMEA